MTTPTIIPATGGALLLAIDHTALPFRRDVCLYLTKPTVRRESVLTPSDDDPDAPDHRAAHFYGTVLHDDGPFGGKFRMWYYACHGDRNHDWRPEVAAELALYKDPLHMGPLCYAESQDGIEWFKPQLNQLLFKGSKAHNAFDLPNALVSGACVIRDDDDPDATRRYKMVYEVWTDWIDPNGPYADRKGPPHFRTCVSGDGIHWTNVREPVKGVFVEHASFYKHDGLYIINGQTGGGFDLGEGGTQRGRTGMAYVSADFENWVQGPAESFALAEPSDPNARGISAPGDQVHLGVGAASFGNVCVGLFGRWHNADFHHAFEQISCDFGLVVSNDGIFFREPVKGHTWLSRHDSPATPHPGHDYHTILCQANGILNVADETRIYHGRWRNTSAAAEHIGNYRAEVGLATLPRDRWGAIGLAPGRAAGHVWTAPFVVPSGGLTLTLNIDDATGVQIAVASEHFEPLPGIIGSVTGDGLDAPVQWSGGDLAACAGRAVRLRITLARSDAAPDPRLYAVNLGGPSR